MDIAYDKFDSFGPLNKVKRVTVLDDEHLLFNIFGVHATAEQDGVGLVPVLAGAGGTHKVLGTEPFE